MIPRCRWLLAIASFCISCASARADMGAPPTLVLDYLYFGWQGAVAGVCLAAALVLFGLRLRKRGWSKWLIILVALLVFVAVDLCCYVIGFGERQERQREYRERWQRQRDAEKKAQSKAANSATASAEEK